MSTAQRDAGPFRLGCLLNPVAGLGGSVGLKGSDGAEIQARARALGGSPRAAGRLAALLDALGPGPELITPQPPLGPVSAPQSIRRVGPAFVEPTTAADTRTAVTALLDAGVDLLLFAGGDGTARDLLDAVRAHGSLDRPVLGLPAGVKMHSGVFAVSVDAAAALLRRLVDGEVLSGMLAEVRDLDEGARRADRVVTRHYGELLVPASPLSVQQVKQGAAINPEEQVADIAAFLAETLDLTGAWAFGPGSTVAAVQAALGLPHTLLGFDLFVDGVVRKIDAAEADLHAAAVGGRLRVLLTPTGGQGHLIGRGNQQLSDRVLARLATADLWIAATPAKLADLRGRPLWIDLDDARERARWRGLREVISGYETRVLWRVADR